MRCDVCGEDVEDGQQTADSCLCKRCIQAGEDPEQLKGK